MNLISATKLKEVQHGINPFAELDMALNIGPFL